MKLKLMSSLAVLSMAAVGCGSSGAGTKAIEEMETAALATQAEVTTLGTFGPPAAYTLPQAYLAMATIVDGGQVDGSSLCPRVKSSGDKILIEGGCSDDQGTSYEGQIEISLDGGTPGLGSVDFKSFTSSGTTECGNGQTAATSQTLDGTFSSKGDRAGSEFHVDMVLIADGPTGPTCVARSETIAMVYDGTIDGPAPSLVGNEETLDVGPSTWNATGEIGISSLGSVTVETRDEVINYGDCPEGALSGTTTLTGVKKAVLTFTGEQECGASATWTLDGVDQGELTGVTCSAMGGGSLSAFGLLALGGLLLRRRRQES